MTPGLAAAQLATGTYVGDGTAGRAITGLDFRPDVVLVKGDGDKSAILRTATMPDGECKRLPEDVALGAEGIESFLDDGFVVSDLDAVNKNGQRFDWVAFAAVDGLIAVDSYNGNAVADRVVLTGFAPDFVLLVPTSASQGLFRTTPMPDGTCMPLDDAAPVLGAMTAFATDGFQVSDDPAVNAPSVEYHWVAWRAEAGRTAVGVYAGDDQDDRDVLGAGLNPLWLLAKGDGADDGVHTTRDLSPTGESLYFANRNADPDRLQALQPDGFQVGSDRDVNQTGVSYYWAGLGRSADLELSLEADRDTASVGGTVAFTATVANAGPDAALDLELRDLLPAGLAYFGDVASDGAYDSGTGSWLIDRLDPGATATLDITAWVLAGTAGTALTDSFVVARFADHDPDPSDDAAAVTVTIADVADLSVRAEADEPAPAVGETAVLTVVAANAGPEDAADATVQVDLPAELDVLSHTAGAGAFDPAGGLWTLPSLAAGDADTLWIEVSPAPGTAGRTLTATFSISSALTDPRPDDDAAAVELQVPGADLALAVAADDTTPQPGAAVLLEVRLANAGPDAAAGVAVEAPLPDGLELEGAEATLGDWSAATGVWTVGGLAVAEAETLRLAARVPADADGAASFAARLLPATPADPDTTNDAVSLVLIVGAAADLAVSAAVAPVLADVGDAVTWTFQVANRGPSPATGVVLADSLPAGAVFLDWEADQGDYDDAQGLWQLGALASGDSVALRISAQIAPGSGGDDLAAAARIVAADVPDPDLANDAASAALHVGGADLALSSFVDRDTLAVGDDLILTYSVLDRGPDPAVQATLRDTLPAGLVYVAHTPADEDYARLPDGSGVWDIGPIQDGVPRVLFVRCRVAPGTTGTELRTRAEVTASVREDPHTANNAVEHRLQVAGTDLALVLEPSTTSPEEGETFTAVLRLSNLGHFAATGVVVADSLDAGLELLAADPPADYDPATGLWNIDVLPAGAAAVLELTLRAASLSGGTEPTQSVRVLALDQVDPEPGNDAASATYVVPVPGKGRVEVSATALQPGLRHPLAPAEAVLGLRLANRTRRAETLRSLSVENALGGPATPAQADSAWTELSLWRRDVDGWRRVADQPAGFVDGRVRFEGLAVALAAADSLDLEVRAAVAASARDGDTLAVRLAAMDDLVWAEDVESVGDWPAATGGLLLVDGFVAAQAALEPVPADVLPPGAVDRSVFDVVLPPDGYATGTLESLRLVNLGTARASDEIAALRVLLDGDVLLGELGWTGDGWLLAGIDQPVGPDGLHLRVVADAAPGAEGLRSIRLAIPVDGVQMAGGGDGPLDAPLVNAYEQMISGSDRLYLGAANRAWRTTVADGAEQLVLHLTATNTFDAPRTVTSLRLSNASRSPWTEDTTLLDQALGQVVLRADADGDGLPGVDDPVLGAASMGGGATVLDGLGWTVPPSATRHLFVYARPTAERAADGDNLAVVLASAVDVRLDADAEVSGQWPLDGGGGLVVDGTPGARFVLAGEGVSTAAPGAADVLLLDLVAPGNGHAADVLDRFAVINTGDADAADVASLTLWRDEGPAGFDPDVDRVLGELAPAGGVWSLAGLDETVPSAGARLFVSADLAPAARDSARLTLALPVDGVGYASGADGPLDGTVVSGRTVIVGEGALQAALAFEVHEVVVGQQVVLRLQVRNDGVDPVLDLVPADPVFAGDGAVTLVSGPQPAAADLQPGASVVFAWTCAGAAVGDVVPTAVASGSAAGEPVATLPLAAAALRVADAPPELGLAALSQLPFLVNGGQVDVSALTLTLRHDGESTAAAVRLDSLVLRLEDAEGVPMAAGGVLSRVLVRADGQLLQSLAVAPDAGSALALVTDAAPVLAAGSEAVLTVSVELSTEAAGAAFRLLIDAAGIGASDAVGGASVGVHRVDGEFPVRSELTRVVAGAPALAVEPAAADTDLAARGQRGVPLGRLHVRNTGDADLGAGIQLGVLALELVDAAGESMASPAACLAALELRRDGAVLARREALPDAAGPLGIALDTPLAVRAGAELVVEVLADLLPEMSCAPLSLRFASTGPWDARDANSGVPVPVLATPDPATTPPVRVVEPATAAHLGAATLVAADLIGGAQDTPLLRLDVRHPGTAEVAPARLDTVRVRCRDAAGQPLAPSALLTRLRLRNGDAILGEAEAASAADGVLAIPLDGALCAPGDTLHLVLAADVRSDPAAAGCVLTVDASDLSVADALLLAPLAVSADAGAVLPLSTGLRDVRIAADELTLAAADRMPAVIAALGQPVPALELTLTNAAPVVAGDLLIASLAFTARDESGAPALGGTVGAFTVLERGEVWAESPEPAAGDTLARVEPVRDLRIPPGGAVVLEVRFAPLAGTEGGGVIVGIDLDGVVATQPEGALTAVRVLPAPGQIFPFATEAGTLAAASLEESYANFPNPFAAGREGTTFVFALDGPARVDLRVFTSRGEPVRTLLSAEHRDAGLHQDVVWDGRNGNGDVVRNGVYIAEITVRRDGGAATTLRRKVAVVR